MRIKSDIFFVKGELNTKTAMNQYHVKLTGWIGWLLLLFLTTGSIMFILGIISLIFG